MGKQTTTIGKLRQHVPIETLSDGTLSFSDLAWLETQIRSQKPTFQVEAAAFDGNLFGGFLSDVLKLTVTGKDGDQSAELQLVIKFVSDISLVTSIAGRYAREAEVYDALARGVLDLHLPVVTTYYTFWDYGTGEKVVIMDNLSDVAGCLNDFYDEAHPLCKEKTATGLRVLKSINAAGVTMYDVTFTIAQCLADFHAVNWGNRHAPSFDLCSGEAIAMLRGGDWFNGRGEKTWLAKQNDAKTRWTSGPKHEEGKARIDPRLVDIVNASIDKINWEAFQRDWQSRRTDLTVVHGDCHPGNLLLSEVKSKESIRESLFFVDLECVGVGLGAVEIGQLLLSHATVEFRREHEKSLLKAYYDRLMKATGNSLDYSFEQCYKDYSFGTAAKCIVFVEYLVNYPDFVEYFGGKVMSWCDDHGITKENVEMPFA